MAMDTLLLKLVLTPALIGTASLAGRRFGPAVGGWLVGFPMTSAPVAFFLTLSHGPGFAAAAAAGSMAGAASQAAFCLAYGWLASRLGWPLALLGSILAFAASTAALVRLVALPPLALFAFVVAVLAAAFPLMPGRDSSGEIAPGAGRAAGTAAGAAPAPIGWDLLAR